MTHERPGGFEAAKEVHGEELPECDSCEEPLGTNGGCILCLYAYESNLRTLGYGTGVK